MNNNILLSIVIPMYNSENYIVDLLKSISKNYGNVKSVEVIIIDDGSKDRSVIVASDSLKELGLNGQVITAKHEGAGSARNIGIKESQGKYILFCDSDDMLVENIIDIVKIAIREEIDVISMEENVSVKHDNKIFYKKNDNLKIAFSMFGGRKFGISAKEYGAGPVRKLFRRKLLVDNNIHFPIGIRWWEDGLFNLKVLCYSNKIQLLKKNMYFIRRNANSTSHNVDEEIIGTVNNFLRLLRETLKDVPSEYCVDIYNQARAFLLWEVFGRFFIFNNNKYYYNQLKYYKNLRGLEKYAINLQSWLLIISLNHFGFKFTVEWYKNAKLIKNRIKRNHYDLK
ncbi:glycosyltransferase family A protein [Limosilactobacillus viscerum]|uniref:glycosyltransferase family A protein n=1 Tax=Limosilactobacillus viscerum TaxID=2993450 RepID=UPI0024B93D9F|nr:glycosyltransferase family A protein [Limosilactobacillus viscerum]